MAVLQAAASPRHSSSPPTKQTAMSYTRGKPLFSAPRKRSVGRYSVLTFPGEDAPGTGRRHFPEELPESRVAAAERPESFGMRSTQDMYRDFPALVRSSYPLYLRTAGPQEPLGLLEQRSEDAGPEASSRRRPAPADTNPPDARLHHPALVQLEGSYELLSGRGFSLHAQEPLGLLERRAEDAGPDTSSRRRPAPVDTNPPRARLHHPEDPEALKKEVASRKGC